MTWLAQVRHVLAKDVRQARWLIVVYVLVTLLATIHTFAQPSDLANAAGGSGISMLLVISLGILAIAMVVQADSPTRSNAFWASRPFYSSAVLAAKIVIGVVVLVGLPVVGQVASLVRFDIAPVDAAALASRSAFLYATWLLAAAIVAALTTDLRGFAVAFVALAIGCVGGGAALFSDAWAPVLAHATLLRVLGALIGGGGGLALLAYLYRRRDVRWTVWIVVVAVVSSALAAGLVNPPQSFADAPTGIAGPSIHLALVNPDKIGQSRQLELRVTVDSAASGDQLMLSADQIVVHLRDGTVLRPTGYHLATTVRATSLPTKRGTKWIGDSTDVNGSPIMVSFLGDDDRRALVAKGVSSIDLDGRVSILRPQLFAELPLAAGQLLRLRGMRTRFVSVSRGVYSATVQLRVAGVMSPRAGGVPSGSWPSGVQPGSWFNSGFATSDHVSLALVNATVGEAIVLRNVNGNSSSDWLILPGTTMYQGTNRLETGEANSSRPDLIRDDAWYRAAHIAVFRWNPQGSYPVHAQLVVR